MAEKEVLEIGVESGQAEAALGRYNALLTQHDAATEKAASSSAKLDTALSRSNQAFDNLANKLRSAGGAVSETFNKIEQSANKVGTLSEKLNAQNAQYEKLKTQLDAVGREFGASSQEAQAFVDQMSELSVSIAETQSEIDATAGALGDYATELDALVASDESLVAAQDEVRAALEEVADAGAAAGADLQKAEAGTKKTGDAAEAAKPKVEGLSKGFESLVKGLSGLPGPIGQAGGLLQGLLSNIEAGQSAFAGLSVGMVAAGTAVAALAIAFGAVRAGIGALTEYSAAVSGVALATGQSVEAVSGLVEAADDASLAATGVGVSAQQAGAELEGFSAKLGRGVDAAGNFTETGKQLQRALDELGVSAVDSSGKLKDQQALLEDIADGFQRIGAGAQATSIAKALDLSSFLPLLLQGRDALKGLTSVITTEDRDRAIAYGKAIDDLDDSFRGLKITIGSFAIGPITAAIRGVTQNFKELLLEQKQIGAYLTGDFKRALEIGKELEALKGLATEVKNVDELRAKGEAEYGESVKRNIERLAELGAANKKLYDDFHSQEQLKANASFDDRAESRKKQEETGPALAQLNAAARQAAALERAAKATDALAKLQANLAKSADLVTAAFDGEVKALGRLDTAKTLLDIVNGKATVEDFKKAQVASGLSEAVAKGQIPIAKGVALASELGKGNLSPQAAALALPPSERKTVLGNIGEVTQGITDVNQFIASGQATPAALLDQLANQRVPVVRRLTRNVPLQDAAQGAINAGLDVKVAEEARKSALEQGQKQGKSEAELKLLGDLFIAPIEAARKAQDKAEKEYNTLKPKLDSTVAAPFIAQQKQLAELGQQRDTTVRELKQRNASQEEINKQTAEFNDKIKKQTETNEKANKLFGAANVNGNATVTTTQVVGSRVIGEGAAKNIKEQIDKVFGSSGLETTLDIKVNAAGFENIKEIQDVFANLKANEQVQLLVSMTGAKDAFALLQKLDDAPSQKEIELALKTSGTVDIDDLLRFINHPETTDTITFKATLDAFGAKTPEEFRNKLALLSDQEIVIALKASGIDDPEKLVGLIRSQIGSGITVPVTAVAQPIAPGNPLLTPQGFGLPAQITVPVTAGTIPPASTKDANDALDGVKDKTVKLLGDNTDLLAKVTSGNTEVAAMPDRTILLKGDTTDIDEKVSNTTGSIDSMPNKVIFIYGNHDGATQSIETVRNELIKLPSDKTVNIHVVTHTSTVLDKCFAAGTPIATPRGHIAIETIRPGDAVYAYDHTAGKVVEARVLQVFTNHADWMRHILFTTGNILVASFTCTPAHPIWSLTRGTYVAASDLFAGELVLGLNGETLAVGAAFYTLGGDTFNFEVEQFNNYFASGVLVHNLSEHVDQQLAGLVGSLTNLKHFGAPGALESAQRMISHTLLPMSTTNHIQNDNSRHAPISAQIITAATASEVMAAFDVMASMAGAS